MCLPWNSEWSGRPRPESKFTKKGDGAKLAAALATCADNYETKYTKATDSFGAACPAVEPVSSFDAYLRQCTPAVEAAAAGEPFPVCGDGTALPATGQVTCSDTDGNPISCVGSGQDGEVQAGATLAYVDNGDGTITDENTGLMWEKQSSDGSIHDFENDYSFADAIAMKVATLNSTAFAGYSDWRLPNVKELETILDFGSFLPAVNGVFRTGCAPDCTVLTCSCTNLNIYWSSTSYFGTANYAWTVYFSDGVVGSNNKVYGYHVRAVRGGL